MILFIYKYFNTKQVNFIFQILLHILILLYSLIRLFQFGLIIRYTVWLICGLLVLFLIRFSLLSSAKGAYYRLGQQECAETLKGLYNIPIYSLSAFGPGWGLFITLSSFNKFQTNIIKQSWFIAFGQFAILFGLDLLALLTEQYLDGKFKNFEWKVQNFVGNGPATFTSLSLDVVNS